LSRIVSLRSRLSGFVGAATRWSRRAFLLVAAAGVALAGRPIAAKDLKPSATIRIEQVQLAWIGSGNLGGGKLEFGGKTYNWRMDKNFRVHVSTCPRQQKALQLQHDNRGQSTPCPRVHEVIEPTRNCEVAHWCATAPTRPILRHVAHVSLLQPTAT
jgi:hypothetical protein